MAGDVPAAESPAPLEAATNTARLVPLHTSALATRIVSAPEGSGCSGAASEGPARAAQGVRCERTGSAKSAAALPGSAPA